jgi:hypothetical protein
MNEKKINLKTMFKSVLKNRIRKKLNFKKHFPKTIYEGKIGINWNFIGVGRNKFIPITYYLIIITHNN